MKANIASPAAIQRHLLDPHHIDALLFEQLAKRCDFWMQHNILPNPKSDKLLGKTIITLFYEDSTRTRTSFEMAAKRLSADVINIAIAHSSVKKGENFIDTIATLDAMLPHAIIIRHAEDGAPALAAQYSNASIINAGDGCNHHPTQALLDAYTLKQHFGQLEGLKIAICGDILHSRVARSNIMLLTKLGAEVTLAAPPALCSEELSKEYGCKLHHHLADALADTDAIILLRIQRERMQKADIPDTQTYHETWGLTHDKLLNHAKKSAIILHPGPVNRGVEISDALAGDTTRFLALKQVTHGLAMRQAILEWLLSDG